MIDGVVESQFHDKITATENSRRSARETADGNRVELLRYLSHPADAPKQVNSFDIGCSRLAVQVENLDKLYQPLCAAGVQFNAPPQPDPNGYVKVAYCCDFDGTIVEFVQVLDKSSTINED